MATNEIRSLPAREAFQGMVRTFNLAIGAKPSIALRVKLIQEEAEEFITAVEYKSLKGAIDGLCDLLYVVYGAADVFNMFLDTASASRTETLSGPQWPKLKGEILDFNDEVGDVVKELRSLHGTISEQFDRCRAVLESLAEGCWMCGAEGLGVDLRPFFREVHRTNMNKLKGPKREDGKQLKPDGWKPPRIEAMLYRLGQGLFPICERVDLDGGPTHTKTKADILPHADGGFHCACCGGLFVDPEIDASMEER